MRGNFVDLDRRFRIVSREEAKTPSLLFDPRLGGPLSWPDLKKRNRVVLLAEAGSGKSYELKSQWQAAVKSDEFACYATVQDLGRSGLEDALGADDLRRFETWKAEAGSICWFFIDSVDEAKDEGVGFETALRKFSKAITGFEDRARVVISGRFTDWDFIADRHSMDEWLSIPRMPPPPEPSYQDEIRATLQHKAPEKPPEHEDDVSVFLMIGLDEARIRLFAKSAGIGDLDSFMTALDDGNLWHFASRPLDLEWMVDYWHDHGRFGTLAAMLEASIDARLIDPKPARKRNDTLSTAAAKSALERIGAGLLLCGKDALRVPAEGFSTTTADNALALDRLLPDWQPDAMMRLLGRPVFDPATLGRVRLHNDNEGTVRSYFTGRWLAGRLAANCPPQQIDDLLFADIYGFQLARPDMLATAAWLSIWNPRVAEKLIARNPLALLTLGDPGALPVATRSKAIEGALQDGEHVDRRNVWLEQDSVRRLAHPAFDPLIPAWWTRYGGGRDARHLLLRLIWLGKQAGGLDIARTQAFDTATDTTSQLLAGRALLAVGTAADAITYADYIVDQAGALARTVVLGALDVLFPKWLSVERFFEVIDAIGVTDEGGMATLYPLGQKLGEALPSETDLSAFLAAVLQRIGPINDEHEESVFASAFASAAVTAAARLLQMHPDSVPNIVVDLVLRLHNDSSYRGRDPEELELERAICSTPGRRRQSFWRAVHVLRDHPWIRNNDISIGHLAMFGWQGQLSSDDVSWLADDATGKTEERDRRLAFNALHAIWRDQGQDPTVAGALEKIGKEDSSLGELLAAWQSPSPEPPERLATMERLRATEEKNKIAREKRDGSWIKFIEELRSDPTILDMLHPTTDTTADSRLVDLWRFLSSRIRGRSRYAIDDLSSVEPIFGAEVTEKFATVLINFANAWKPLLPSERPPEEQRKIFSFESMGLAGMALEAARTSNWAQSIDDDRAAKAARYAILELNGFPDYLVRVAEAKPAIVRKVLVAEVNSQLAMGDPSEHGILDRLAYSDAKLARLVVPDLEHAMSDEATFPTPLLPKVLDVIIRGLPVDTTSLSDLVRSRAAAAQDPKTVAYMLSILAAINADLAIDVLRERFDQFDEQSRMMMCSVLLPRLYGDRYHQDTGVAHHISFPKLEELVLLAFDGIRPENDIRRPSGEVFSPDWRDSAQDARNTVFNRLESTPGEATHAALMRLSRKEGFAIPPDRLHTLARRHAENDAILAAWRPEDVVMFETAFDRPPSTTADLQLLARRRAERIDHDLRHDRFSQADTVQALPDENAVQRWFADRFESLQGNAYTVVRESHVADEKEPDITLTSRISGVTLPIEIKVIDGMSAPEMEAALETQLCGQYLRHDGARHGILLLVHQKPKSQGWILPGHSRFASLETVLKHLNEKATEIRSLSPDGPQPIVVCIDVSTISPRRRKARSKEAKLLGPLKSSGVLE